jgi:hypothetical protein
MGRACSISTGEAGKKIYMYLCCDMRWKMRVIGPVRRLKHTWADNIKIDLRVIGRIAIERISVVQARE